MQKAQTFIRADLRSIVVCCPAHRIERLPSAALLNLLKREPFTRQILLFKGENWRFYHRWWNQQFLRKEFRSQEGKVNVVGGKGGNDCINSVRQGVYRICLSSKGLDLEVMMAKTVEPEI